MNNNFTKSSLAKSLFLVAGSFLIIPVTFASTPWNGTADYTAALTSAGDEAAVGPFDTYDFGPGIGLIKPDGAVAAGQTFQGYFQTVVTGHLYQSNALTTPELNVSGASGSGNGFELTVRSYFEGTYVNVSANSLDFNITSGTAGLYFDTTPDYNFANDSGFANDEAILSGAISTGIGSIIFPNVIGVGVETVNLDISGVFGGFNADIFEPDTIGGGSAIFSIKTKTPSNSTPIIDQVTNGSAKSVSGLSIVGGQLFELDGQMQLTAVPVPGAAWLFLSAIMGLLSVTRRKFAA